MRRCSFELVAQYILTRQDGDQREEGCREQARELLRAGSRDSETAQMESEADAGRRPASLSSARPYYAFVGDAVVSQGYHRLSGRRGRPATAEIDFDHGISLTRARPGGGSVDHGRLAANRGRGGRTRMARFYSTIYPFEAARRLDDRLRGARAPSAADIAGRARADPRPEEPRSPSRRPSRSSIQRDPNMQRR